MKPKKCSCICGKTEEKESVVCGEITVDFHKSGNWQDLADILLMNGYSLEISMEKDKLPFGGSENKINMTIFKEEN